VSLSGGAGKMLVQRFNERGDRKKERQRNKGRERERERERETERT
jgi:hypothetical protein